MTTRLVIPIYKEEKVKAAPAQKFVSYKLYQEKCEKKKTTNRLAEPSYANELMLEEKILITFTHSGSNSNPTHRD